ncbi:hypothetical protein [Actinoplanes sp. CA-252034]|uniref:hypothetical protein n=1 Tax=Actinoplanes sp. CA-252034 TaxID=3239906 RepID=UPI003D9789B4
MAGFGSIFVASGPAYAAPTCSTTKLSETWLGTGGGWSFSCYNSTSGGVWVSIACASSVSTSNRTSRREHRPVGYPWSWGTSIRCSNLEYAASPRWGAL